MAKRLLLVDDEALIVKGLKYSLEQEGYEIEVAYDGLEAMKLFEQGNLDLIILDLMLPKLDGTQVCQRIRETSNIPIIMLTARDADMDKIMGLEYGADDYMTKPFNILELKARIKTILRRVQGSSVHSADAGEIINGRLRMNLSNRNVYIEEKMVNLTAKEFDLLQFLAENPGKVYSREMLLETVWRYDYLGDLRTVDVHIRRLREKIERDPSKPEFILTKWGVGYYFGDQ